MSRVLHISPDLSLPADTVTQTIVVYGGKGMGKTVFGAVLAEELARAHLRFCLLDPIGSSWGLRYNKYGKGAGLDLLILGGTRGDLPILSTAGTVVADLVVDETVNVLVDISRHPDGKMWSHGEKTRFVTDYATRLFERQGERSRPLMQIIDEAGRFVPQQIQKGAIDMAKCVGAIEQLVELGRNVGVGVCLITQRSARMNKSVSELAECMIAFRTVGPNSVDAILDWFGEHVPKERWRELVETLRKLPRGQALVVSPGWLEYEGVANIRMRTTFDSSATPKSEGRGLPTRVERPDLDAYRSRMAATIEEAKSRDPREAQRVIAELRKKVSELEQRPASVAKTAVPKRIEVPILTKAHEKLLGQTVERFERAAETLADNAKALQDYAHQVVAELRLIGRSTPPSMPTPTVVVTRPAPRSEPSVDMSAVGKLGKAERKILAALAQYPHGRTITQLALLTGYAVNGGGFRNAMGRLRSLDLITGQGTIQPTIRGEALGRQETDPLPPPGSALLSHWRHQLPHAEREILRVLEAYYPRPISPEEIASQTQSAKGGPYESDGGGFRNALGRLRTLELIEGRGELRLVIDLVEAR